jgi:hypothetical protein
LLRKLAFSLNDLALAAQTQRGGRIAAAAPFRRRFEAAQATSY